MYAVSIPISSYPIQTINIIYFREHPGLTDGDGKLSLEEWAGGKTRSGG